MSVPQVPALLTGTESALVGEVPGAGPRWSQVHFTISVTRRFFGLTAGSTRSITLERINGEGKIVARSAQKLVFAEKNRNSKIEFNFRPLPTHPGSATRPILVVVDAGNSNYRYRLLMPGDGGYAPMAKLLGDGPLEDPKPAVPRRIVTLDEVEQYWPQAMLRGGI